MSVTCHRKNFCSLIDFSLSLHVWYDIIKTFCCWWKVSPHTTSYFRFDMLNRWLKAWCNKRPNESFHILNFQESFLRKFILMWDLHQVHLKGTGHSESADFPTSTIFCGSLNLEKEVSSQYYPPTERFLFLLQNWFEIGTMEFCTHIFVRKRKKILFCIKQKRKRIH